MDSLQRTSAFTALLLGAAGLEPFGERAIAEPSGSIPIDSDDIAGVVTSERGPEAGVWVIAETDGLPTKLRKIVVTDDDGRYLLPDLPRADYVLWVRGYGLVDSPRTRATPGNRVALRPSSRRTPARRRRFTRPTTGIR